ncbi:MAG: tetratricopeptide repeat protein [Thermotogae bacterium]|nr:tetratricopeptide repeat protein [Thermotogota bacterium]
MRRIVLIILLVILGAAIGGGIGVGVAIYLLQQRITEQVSGTAGDADTTTETLPEAARTVQEIVQKEERTTGRSSSEFSTSRTKVSAKERRADTSSGEITADTIRPMIAQKADTPTVPTSRSQKATKNSGSGDITVPTIDLSSTIDLNTTPKPKSGPSIPTVEPDIKKGTTPTLRISSLSEEEVKKVYYSEGNLVKAERMLRKELKQNPKNSMAKKYLRLIKLERQALALEAQGDNESAQRIWQQILRIAPDHPRAKKKVH